MRRPIILDLFCGAGGAGWGYYKAGFNVVGVDIKYQRKYPFRKNFIWGDALNVKNWPKNFDAIHASPPCQRYSVASNCRSGLSDEYPDLIDETRELLIKAGVPYVIENVPQAPLLDPIMLCGHMFGLELYRHRNFESNVKLLQPDHPEHIIPGTRAGRWIPGTIISVAGNVTAIAQARHAMGIDWMSRAEIVEAIPPRYTTYIGRQLKQNV